MHKRKTDGQESKKGFLLPRPSNILSLCPVLEMYSQRELIIENVKSLEHYDEKSVRVRTKNGCVTVTGRALTVRCLASGNIAVCGSMDAIGFDEA